MADWTPKRETITRTLDRNVAITEFENTVEQRRLISDQILSGYKVQTPNMLPAQAKTYSDFFLSKFGALTSFTMPDPFNAGADVRVRFVPGTWTESYAAGVMRITFELKRVSF